MMLIQHSQNLKARINTQTLILLFLILSEIDLDVRASKALDIKAKLHSKEEIPSLA